jgi:ribosomal protein L11 methyltransferase
VTAPLPGAAAPVNELRSPDLPRAAAHALAEAIETAIWPEPLAVTLAIADETADLWSVVALYDGEVAHADVVDAAPAARDAQFGPLADADWVRRSLDGLAPVRAGRFCLHGSHDRHRRPPSGVAIEIDAGTAFGTGHHATTAGCLMAMDGLLKQRRFARVLDVGCGTGVLAIAAARANRSATVVAGDIDPEAVRVTRLNARLNGARVMAVTATGASHPAIGKSAPHELILANILARPLMKLAPSLMGIAAPGGRIVLSGLLCPQERMVEAAWKGAGAIIVARLRKDGWSTLILARRPKRPPPARPKRLRIVSHRRWRYLRTRALP